MFRSVPLRSTCFGLMLLCDDSHAMLLRLRVLLLCVSVHGLLWHVCVVLRRDVVVLLTGVVLRCFVVYRYALFWLLIDVWFATVLMLVLL